MRRIAFSFLNIEYIGNKPFSHRAKKEANLLHFDSIEMQNQHSQNPTPIHTHTLYVNEMIFL